MVTTEPGCAAWHRALERGISVVEGEHGHLYILGPAGTEGLARELRAAPAGLIHRLIADGCDCNVAWDEAYKFGELVALFQPGRFTREQYLELRILRQRFSQGDLACVH